MVWKNGGEPRGKAGDCEGLKLDSKVDPKVLQWWEAEAESTGQEGKGSGGFAGCLLGPDSDCNLNKALEIYLKKNKSLGCICRAEMEYNWC